jgi:hypothetical protein
MLINELFNSNSEPVIEGVLDNPGQEDSPVASAIIRRILLQRTDLLAKYGPERVGAAVDDVADSVGDWDEIGSSDVSGWVRQVEQMLGDMQEGVAEGTGETPQQQKVRAAISNGLAKSSQMGKSEYQSQPTNRTYFDNAGYASDKLTGIDSIDSDGTVVISIGDTRAADWVKKLATLGGMPGIKTREVQPKLAEGDIGQLEKDIADAPVEPIANMEAQEKIGGRYDADDFDDMVSRLKKLAGAGPMKTVYDPDRRVYRNMPTAQQPAQQPKK